MHGVSAQPIASLDHSSVPAMGSATNVRVLPSWAEVTRHLAPHWNELLAKTACPSVFQTWDYVNAWWKVYGAECRLHIIVGEQDGVPSAIRSIRAIRAIRAMKKNLFPAP